MRTRSNGKRRRRRRTVTFRARCPPSTAVPTSTRRRWSRKTICRRRADSTVRWPRRTEAMSRSASIARHRFAILTATATYALLFLGGLVTSTGSGLAVPDWPLSFGQVMPEMVGGVLFEHGHRMAASLVGFLTLILSIWTVVSETRPGVRALGIAMILAVVLQGVLGGVTVLYKLPIAVSVTHACLAQTFFCLAVTMAIVTGPSWGPPRARPLELGAP